MIIVSLITPQIRPVNCELYYIVFLARVKVGDFSFFSLMESSDISYAAHNFSQNLSAA